jgi:CheY-like chemotaxis protein
MPCQPWLSPGRRRFNRRIDSHPDLLLMDIGLKDQRSGVEAVERLRLRGHMPAASVTPYADDTPVRRAKVTVPFGYLLRPFDANG